MFFINKRKVMEHYGIYAPRNTILPRFFQFERFWSRTYCKLKQNKVKN